LAAKENLIGGALLGRLANSLGAFVVGRRRRLSLDHRCAALSGKNSRIGHLLDYLVGCANYMALFIGLGVGLSHGEIGKSALYLGLAAGVANPIILLVRLCHERRSGADAVAHPYLVGVELEDSFI